uniref:Uncharacterized protein n=1 Tax=Anguilla anguilla TaxID=7936 RepID=A0A0E9PXM8_ANGAN
MVILWLYRRAPAPSGTDTLYC